MNNVENPGPAVYAAIGAVVRLSHAIEANCQAGMLGRPATTSGEQVVGLTRAAVAAVEALGAHGTGGDS
ncbi:hypothetical protein HUT18_11815 [Streptomyces sp. NA04227]|uniref:hypothetical protein n=1 Tax=Streptomyces sp. NA04227 TaxID=2742136 RepID=UPI00158FD939|nr:hypothetical protein [Streptomyces sp. NA04227]QKW06985.1 hypothetical protein HUT18_11815 [Streptomyces sp. NA04227]